MINHCILNSAESYALIVPRLSHFHTKTVEMRQVKNSLLLATNREVIKRKDSIERGLYMLIASAPSRKKARGVELNVDPFFYR